MIKQGLITLLLSLGNLSAQERPKLSTYLAQCPLLEVEDRTKLSDSIRSLEESGRAMSVASYAPNEVVSLSVTLLPMINGTPVIGVIQTYKRPRLDSHVRFFAPDWVEIPAEKILASAVSADSFLSDLNPESESLTFRLRLLLSPLYTQKEWSEEGLRLFVWAKPVLSLEDKALDPLVTWVTRLPRLEYIWRQGRLERL